MTAQGPDRVELAVAAAAIAIGGGILAGSFSITFGAGYDRIGPRFFPYVVAAGLVISGTLLTRDALRRGKASVGPSPDPTSGSALVTLGVALVASVLLLDRAGFIVTAALLFTLVARAFESRRPFRDAAVGLSLAALTYVAFTRGLGLALPGGLLGGFF